MPALIFDCDGVLADTERDGHRAAFNETFAEVGLPVHWSVEEYAEKLKIGGGKERMASLLTPEFVAANGLPADADGQQELIADWHRRKTASYKAMVADGHARPRGPGSPAIVDRGDRRRLDARRRVDLGRGVGARRARARGRARGSGPLQGLRRRRRAGQEARSGDLRAGARQPPAAAGPTRS